MKEITLKIPNKHFHFFNELIEQLGYVEKMESLAIQKKKPSEKEKILAGIERGLKEVKLAKEGKLKTKSLKQFLSEV